MSAYTRILMPIDGSPTSDRALDEAIRLARLDGARLRLLHVVDELSYVNGFEPAMAYLNDTLPLMQQAGEKLLADARKKAQAQGVAADSVLIVGRPGRLWEHVVEQAGSMKADLLVVGSHGRRGLGRALMGSDAEQIVRHAPAPVLVVRAAGAGQAPGAPGGGNTGPIPPA
ncbi:MAG: universal stress protein [Polaromonas sp.]|uniref:universal stress protein n=1 Tax=Polaromonas sp. TaxID=1869339 RepID=UPI004034F8D4